MEVTSNDRPQLSDALHELFLCHDRLRATWKSKLQLGANEMSALLHLANAGPLAMGELSERIKLSSAALTALVDRLEAMEYARRSSDPNDRRRVLLHVTDRAVDDLGRVRAGLVTSISAYVEDLDDVRRVQLETGLDDLSKLVQQHVE